MDKSMYDTIEKYMYDCMKDAAHDHEHIFRVLYNALDIASKRQESINYDVLIAACLLHDIGRAEQFKNPGRCHAKVGASMAKEFLLENGWSKEAAKHVKRCISSHRFKGKKTPESIEAKILFDADKLDVTGCLGIARTLLYEGAVGDKLYVVKNDEICLGETKDDEESFFKEYNRKLKNVHERFFTEEARETAAKQNEYAQFFYDKLLEQLLSARKAGLNALHAAATGG